MRLLVAIGPAGCARRAAHRLHPVAQRRAGRGDPGAWRPMRRSSAARTQMGALVVADPVTVRGPGIAPCLPPSDARCGLRRWTPAARLRGDGHGNRPCWCGEGRLRGRRRCSGRVLMRKPQPRTARKTAATGRRRRSRSTRRAARRGNPPKGGALIGWTVRYGDMPLRSGSPPAAARLRLHARRHHPSPAPDGGARQGSRRLDGG